MGKDQLLTILTTILQQNTNNFNSNELFGMVSLMLLLEIIEIFKFENNNSTTKLISTKQEEISNPPLSNNLTGLLNQFQNNSANNNNLQQMLPLLLKILSKNNSNNNLDLNNLLKLINSINLNPKKENEEITDKIKNEPENESEKKK